MRLAVCAFHANANVRPTAPKDVVPYEIEEEVEHVTHEDFVRDYKRMRGRD